RTSTRFPYTTLFRSTMYSIPQTNTDLKRDSRKFKIYNIEFRFEEFAKVLARQAITEFLESIDNQYFESKRWKSTHKNHGFKERTDRKSTRLNSSHVK